MTLARRHQCRLLRPLLRLAGAERQMLTSIVLWSVSLFVAAPPHLHNGQTKPRMQSRMAAESFCAFGGGCTRVCKTNEGKRASQL